MAQVLHHTTNAAAGAVITDPTTGDTITRAGVTKTELKQNREDFRLHG